MWMRLGSLREQKRVQIEVVRDSLTGCHLNALQENGGAAGADKTFSGWHRLLEIEHQMNGFRGCARIQ
jgi:hypothetical protein